MKRNLDVILAAFGLVILSPLFAALAVLIKFTDGGPVFYRCRRVGRNGKTFVMIKFRTMVVNAGRTGIGITTAADRRITPVGRLLRRYKIDEIPQLFNIVRGDMAFVGPRPEDPRYVELYDASQRKVFSVRPGLTSPASLMFKDEASLLVGSDWEEKYIKEIIPRKLSVDIDYFERNTFWSDCAVIVRTLLDVTRPVRKAT